ncbi:MAG: acyl-CoA mutase large subunit family protein [Synergistaceae bacterium]|nr:acyl-CoA mutase large subunit family protein [Synergistaceae bacterium]
MDLSETNELNGGCGCCEAGGGASGSLSAEIDFSEFPTANYEKWKEAAVTALKGTPFEKSMYTSTYEGITLEPLYTAEHVKNLGAPGTFPGAGSFLRGGKASGYIANPWEIVQPCDIPFTAEANAQIRHELEKGVTTLAILLDGLTLWGVDADAPGTEEREAKRRGVSVSALYDLERLFESIDLTRYPIHIYAGASSAPLLGFIAACAENGGVPLDRLRGCIGADPLGSWLRNGVLLCGLDRLFDETAHAVLWAKRYMPGMKVIRIQGGVVHNGGGSAVQEVGCAIAAAVETFRALHARQVDIDTFASHLSFEFSQSSNFFMEIAKIRAARTVWAQVAEAFGGSEASKKADIFGRTSFFTKTLYDPYVNMLRNTTEAFSAVLGGVDGLTVGCFDEAARPGDEFSRRTARNAQILLREEFSLVQPVDPAGGSWYLESLTDTLARKIWECFQKIEAEGGFSACAQSGTIQSSVEEVLSQRFKKLSGRSDRAVGINMYANTQERPLECGADAENISGLCGKRREELSNFRASREEMKVREALEAMTANAREGGDLVGAIARAAKAGATLGEVRNALNEGNEEHLLIMPVGVHRWTEQYEALRRRTEKFKADTGNNVKIFLANMGPIPQHKARADFITGFVEVAGFEVLKNNGFPTTDECAGAAAASGADVAVICSTDDSYPELVPPLARSIKEKAPAMTVFLAGVPKEEFKQSYLDAGVDDFISVRSNCLAALSDLQKAKGML